MDNGKSTKVDICLNARYVRPFSRTDNPYIRIISSKPFPRADLPEVGNKEFQYVTNRHYKWVEVPINDPFTIEEMSKTIPAGFALQVNKGIFVYRNETQWVKFFKKDVTPHYIPEDAVKMPNDMTIATKLLSEKAAETAASVLIKRMENGE